MANVWQHEFQLLGVPRGGLVCPTNGWWIPHYGKAWASHICRVKPTLADIHNPFVFSWVSLQSGSFIPNLLDLAISPPEMYGVFRLAFPPETLNRNDLKNPEMRCLDLTRLALLDCPMARTCKNMLQKNSGCTGKILLITAKHFELNDLFYFNLICFFLCYSRKDRAQQFKVAAFSHFGAGQMLASCRRNKTFSLLAKPKEQTFLLRLAKSPMEAETWEFSVQRENMSSCRG